MNQMYHILVSTKRSPGIVMDALGINVQIHFAQDTEGSLDMAASLRPHAAIIDITDLQFSNPDYIRLMRRNLKPSVPLIGWADEKTSNLKLGKLLRAGLWDIWMWSDSQDLNQKRLTRLLELCRKRRKLKSARRERRMAQKALVRFLSRFEETLVHPLDSLEAHLLLLYADTRRDSAPAVRTLDQIAIQHQEIRQTLLRIRKLTRTLSLSDATEEVFPENLEETPAEAPFARNQVRIDPQG
ncbi:MAG: hypothetical protein KJ970_18250 [Candidatus Eisenbacteria bacterium]|uniref:Uncharacterized protein n=1 Tax=Eiseniibacteriota bacterium TaxID=2212470 RepID=A0A948RXX4_UNCEI|nr:hypothetical protein [Candidatus Eisenbacteria bacterium]MBU1950883.1 hypothetical protein [Candidatus Eisenbacteria bacterium]MBU2692865.1 hypothetical protein [Candidatus Eisenbacteria bacterium]